MLTAVLNATRTDMPYEVAPGSVHRRSQGLGPGIEVRLDEREGRFSAGELARSSGA